MNTKGLVIGFLSLAAVTAFAGRSGQFGEANLTAVMHVSQPIVITAQHNLDFGEVVSGTAQDVVVAASDASAAQFSATGEPSAEVTAGMVARSLTMTNTVTNDTITVDTFTYGGDIDKKNTATFDKNGALSDLRVGGTAHVTSNAGGGDYTGTGKFRLTYV